MKMPGGQNENNFAGIGLARLVKNVACIWCGFYEIFSLCGDSLRSLYTNMVGLNAIFLFWCVFKTKKKP